MDASLIAPCGMNCALCDSYQTFKLDLKRQRIRKTSCPGCLPRGKHCQFMKSSCSLLGEGKVRFCFECSDYPCKRLKSLDLRYRTRYHMSMLENLSAIQSNGMDTFLQQQSDLWNCPTCGGEICCHNGLCLRCDLEKLRTDPTYRWGSSQRGKKP